MHDSSAYPFYYLDPVLNYSGSKWWAKRLRPLIEATSLNDVTNNVFCIEYFGYHSSKFGHERLKLTSMEYGFQLVRRAIERNALIVMMRAKKHWESAVPDLVTYNRVFGLRSSRNITISPKNCPEGFDQIVTVIKGR